MYRQNRSRVAEAFLIAAVVAACLTGLILSTATDPDLWGHVTFGRDILASRAVTHSDTYSFTSDRPWVNHEWLSEVLMAAAYSALGPSGLILLKVLVVGVMAFLVVGQLRRARIPFESAVVLLMLAVIGTKTQTAHIRPQLFSMLLFAALLTALTLADAGKRRALLAVPAIFLIWTNLHGGWIVGAGVLAIWTAVRPFDPKGSASDRRQAIMIAASAAAATVVNPFGVKLWQFLLETVRIDRTEITDWQPVTYSPDILIVWLAVAATAVLMLWRTRMKPPIFNVVTLGLLAAGSFRLLRLEPFFAIAATLLLPAILMRSEHRASMAHRPPSPVSSGTTIAVIVLSAAGVAVGSALIVRNGSCIRIDPQGNPDPEATTFVQQHALRGRMITWFDWGEYAIWHFGPAIQVSMDGRRETVYSPAVTSAHLAFYRGDASLADRLNANYIWLPKDVPVIDALRDAGWSALFDGPVSTILGRTALTPSLKSTAPAARRCFPGP